MARFRAFSLALLLTTASQLVAPSSAGRPWLNTSMPVEQRVNFLLSQMTLEEKVQQMGDRAPAIPRLGVPAYFWWNEGNHGVAVSGTATNFPQVIGMAATWDTALVHREAEVISTEARAKYNEAMRHDQHEMFYGPRLLRAQHQHLSRSALGTRAGDLLLACGLMY